VSQSSETCFFFVKKDEVSYTQNTTQDFLIKAKGICVSVRGLARLAGSAPYFATCTI